MDVDVGFYCELVFKSLRYYPFQETIDTETILFSSDLCANANMWEVLI